MSMDEAVKHLNKTLTKIFDLVYPMIVERNMINYFEGRTVYINQKLAEFNREYPRKTSLHITFPDDTSSGEYKIAMEKLKQLNNKTCSFFANQIMSQYSTEILENFKTVEDYVETIEAEWINISKDPKTLDYFEKNHYPLNEANVKAFKEKFNTEFEQFKTLKDRVEEEKKKGQKKNMLIYEKFHNFEDLPLVCTLFPLVGEIPKLSKKTAETTENVHSAIVKSVENAIKENNFEGLKKFVEQNPSVRFSNRIFDLCALYCAEDCFKYLYSLITEDELKLEAKFYNHAVSNLALGLNYIGEKFYKVSTKAQVASETPDMRKILAGNFSIVSESVFDSAFEALKKNKEKGISFFRLLFKYRIVGSDLTKSNMSESNSQFSGYVSLYGNYLNAGLR